jgi:hypothetical protein
MVHGFGHAAHDKLFALGVRPRVTWFVMKVVSSCPMDVDAFVWQLKSGAFAQTIIAKATFVLEPGHAKLAAQKDRVVVHDRDVFVKDDPQNILWAPTDKVPYKRRVDVLLVGHAYAPGKLPVRSLVTKLVVGSFSKAIEVVCDRGFRKPEERLIEGPHFTKMPLDWTRAAGGSNTSNPVGRSFDSAADVLGLHSLPNLQPPRTFVSKGSDPIAPIGYGPIAPTWQDRAVCVEHLGTKFSRADWDKQPLPEHFDFDYFQSAPSDQQIAELRPDEALVLQNLHHLHGYLETRLPGILPRAVVQRASGERDDVTFVADTLWIDTDRGICCVVWRGTIGLSHADEEGLIGVALVEPIETNEEPAEENVVETIPTGLVQEDELASMTMIAPFAKPKGETMPFVETNLPERSPTPVRSNDDGALPFGPAGLLGFPPAPIARGQITLPAQSPTSSPTIPGMTLEPAPNPPAPSVAPSMVFAARSTPVATITAQSVLAPAWSIPDHDAPTIPTREVVQLLWVDLENKTRLRLVEAWKPFLQAENDDFFAVLRDAPRLNPNRLSEVFAAALNDEEKFVSPLAVIAGDLEFPFDELESLKAAMSAAIPLITSADEQLQEAVQVAKNFVQTPGLLAAPAVCEGLTERIRAALSKTKKGLPEDYLDTQMQRVLITGRHYQRCEVFGKTYLRAFLGFAAETAPQIAYVPAEAAKVLPMLKKLPTRLIVEVHPAQEQFEARTIALKVVAMSRVGLRKSPETFSN